MMDCGIQLATSAHSWKVVQRAEEIGYTHAWFFDTQLLNAEMFVAMGAAATHTSKIKLGTGVLIPSNRIEAVTASALASLNALAPGRILFGVGTGFTARRTMGLRAISLARLEKYVRGVQGLLAGETVEWSEQGRTHKIRFLNPELELINIKDPIPLHISAFGPRGQQLTAKLDAGWMAPVRDPRRPPIIEMSKAWLEAGRDLNTLYATGLIGGCVLQEGEPPDSPRALAQAGPAAAIAFHNFAEEQELGSIFLQPPPHLEAQFERYREIYRSYEPADARYMQNHRGHLMVLRPEEREILTGDVIRALTHTATQPELVQRLKGLKAAGYSQLSVGLRYGHEMEMLEDWAEVFAKV